MESDRFDGFVIVRAAFDFGRTDSSCLLGGSAFDNDGGLVINWLTEDGFDERPEGLLADLTEPDREPDLRSDEKYDLGSKLPWI